MFARKGEGPAKPTPKLKVKGVLQEYRPWLLLTSFQVSYSMTGIAGLALRGQAEFKQYCRGESMQLASEQKLDIYTHRNIGQVDQEIHSAKIARRNIIKEASWEFPERGNLG